MRVPHRKTYKMTVMTSSNQKFEKMKKSVISNFCSDHLSAFSSKSDKNCGKYSSGHTDAQTDAQTGLILRVKIFSPEITEYKNVQY